MRASMMALALAAAVGCAGNAGQAKKGAVTATADDAKAAFDAAVNALTMASSSLGRIVEATQADLVKSYETYVADLKTLDGKVAELRALAVDIQARRDEYLQLWVEKTQGISSPELKARAEKRRAELSQEFQALAGKGAAVRRAFGPLHAAMKDVALYLEADLTTAGVKDIKPELDAVRAMNLEVRKLSEDYQKALGDIRAKLTTPGAPAGK